MLRLRAPASHASALLVYLDGSTREKQTVFLWSDHIEKDAPLADGRLSPAGAARANQPSSSTPPGKAVASSWKFSRICAMAVSSRASSTRTLTGLAASDCAIRMTRPER